MDLPLQEGVATATPLLSENADPGGNVRVEFDRESGYEYMCLPASIILPCCFPIISICARKHIDSQECEITDRRVQFEAGWLEHKNSSIPLDRIQDVNVRENVISKCFGVKTLEIQTAGMGGMTVKEGWIPPEAFLIAPRDPFLVREIIMNRRDELMFGRRRARQAASESLAGYSAASIAQDMHSIKDTLTSIDARLAAHLAQAEAHKETA